MVGFAGERLMELEVGAATWAAYGGKDPARLVQRNGYLTPETIAPMGEDAVISLTAAAS